MAVLAAGIYVFSLAALDLAHRLAGALAASPWLSPDGMQRGTGIIYAPARLVQDMSSAPGHRHVPTPFSSIGKLLEKEFSSVWAHIFIGATGIAVRGIAPFLTHKSADPPVIVIDPSGAYVISLLSGHWGGGNDLARHLAKLIGAQAVLTTASDAAPGKKSLDLLIRNAGLRVLDWPRLAAMQGCMLEDKTVHLYDPQRLLPFHPLLAPVRTPEDAGDTPLVLVDWKKHKARAQLLRLVPPVFHLGFAFRKGVQAEALLEAFEEFCSNLNLAPEALASCASVSLKAEDPEALRFASMIKVPLRAFPAESLVKIKTPNPSGACGKRFSLPPFSVCESAALLACMPHAQENSSGKFPALQARLFSEKFKFKKMVTMALALSANDWKCLGLPGDLSSIWRMPQN